MSDTFYAKLFHILIVSDPVTWKFALFPENQIECQP